MDTLSHRKRLLLQGNSDSNRGNPILALNPIAYFMNGTGITVTGSGVSQWDDATGLGHHLLQGTDAARPALQADGSILFNGTSHFLKTAAFTLNQPTTVVLVFKQVSWTGNDRVFDGVVDLSGVLYQGAATPQLWLYAGTGVASNSNLSVGSVGVAQAVFSGAASLLQINNTTPTTGNAGAGNMGGFTLGAGGTAGTTFSHIQAYEAALFPSALSAADRARVARYSMAKFGIP